MKKYKVTFHWSKSIDLGIIKAKDKEEVESLAWEKMGCEEGLVEELGEERFDINEVKTKQ